VTFAPTAPDIIEGSFRVVSTVDLKPRRSPKRDRLVARIVFWNVAGMIAVVALPILF
jgi:hypothetical protein